jgi:site-specific DNA recombinase
VIAVGYARRSKESGARTISLEEQAARIEAYCSEQRWALADVVIDDGISGGRRERLDRIAARVHATGARAVVVYHLDRFARDVAGLLDSVRAFARRGVELHVVGRGRVETDTASGFLVTGVEGLMAEHYRRLIGEKTRDALARLRAKGRRVSRWPPYGFTFGPDGRLMEDPGEHAIRQRIVALSASGVSLRALSRALAAEGIFARSGRPFGPEMLSRIVHNPSLVDNTSPSTVGRLLERHDTLTVA